MLRTGAGLSLTFCAAWAAVASAFSRAARASLTLKWASGGSGGLRAAGAPPGPGGLLFGLALLPGGHLGPLRGLGPFQPQPRRLDPRSCWNLSRRRLPRGPR